MDLFRTPTPPYNQQPDGPRPSEATGVLGWFASLLRTRTPAYTYPAPTTKKARANDTP